jgi:hypothetical protein
MGWGNWIGTGNIAAIRRQFRSFSDARSFARRLQLRSQTDWQKFACGKLPNKSKRPPDIPSSPQTTYANDGWQGWGDWLGTGNIAPGDRRWCSFCTARKFVHSLRLSGAAEWRQYCAGELKGKPKKPNDIPSNPAQVYAASGWQSLGDWLGTGFVAFQQRRFRAFVRARTFARSLNLTSIKEWTKYAKGETPDLPPLPPDIPADPYSKYRRDGWQGWGDWLGTGRVANYKRVYRPFPEARAFAQKLGIRSISQWMEYIKGQIRGLTPLPFDVPRYPNETYSKDGWQGWGDWLHRDGRPSRFRDFASARAFVRRLELKNVKQWRAFSAGRNSRVPKRPNDIPGNPNTVYAKHGWRGFPDWLGTTSRSQ